MTKKELVEYYLQAYMDIHGNRGWVNHYFHTMSLPAALHILKGRREVDPITPYRIMKKTTTYEVLKGT